MNKRILVFTLFLTTIMFGQNKGTITGTVYDKEADNASLPFANVFIKGTTIGTTTDIEGNYSFKVDSGTYTLVFSFIGYERIEQLNVIVKAGETIKVDKILNASTGVSLTEIQITGSTKKESESALLTVQKKAVTIEQKIGAQELARKGVSDVATALTKTTGISKEEGSGVVFVRGLGDRYNVTTLNGLPLPSNNPSNKNIDLDIFSTDIVEFIGIDKTYNTKNYGDFAGANINIASKNYKGQGFLEVGVGTGTNTEVIGQSDFYLNDGPNFSGFYDKKHPAFPLNNYNFTTSWDREKAENPINLSLSLKGGDSYSLGDETRLSFFAVASFDNSYKYKEGVSRGGVTVNADPNSDFDYFNYEYKTNTTLMGNIGLKHKGNDLKYNVLYLNSSSQKQQEYFGVIDKDDDASEGGGFIQRAVFDRTSIIINQLLGDHKIGEKFDVNWGVSYNMVENNVPNRRQVTLLPVKSSEPDGPKSFQLISSASDNHRFYQNLNEDELAANISTTFKFKENSDYEFDGKLTVGYNGRIKKVDFEATQFNFEIVTRNSSGNLTTQPIVEDIHNIDAYFNQANLNAGLFKIKTFRGGIDISNALDPQTFGGDQDIHAGYLSLEYALSQKLTFLAGIRGEQITQFIKWSTSLDPSGDESNFDKFEILPALSLKYELNDEQNLKFAASKTYTLPQYKERAFFLFQEVNQDYQGNPGLYASTDYNADIKWEIFPSSSELLSLGVFGKYIENPINTATINSASNDISYVNSGDWATVFGAEFEIRKNLIDKDKERGENTLNTNLSFGVNASYMITNQELNNEKVLEETTESGKPLSIAFTEEDDRLSGASDLLLNADISYITDFSNDMSFQTTLAFNYFSDRIFALGVLGKGNLVDKGVGTLDFIAKYHLNKDFTIGVSAKNILNPTIERFQDIQNVTVSSFKAGVDAKLSISYNF